MWALQTLYNTKSKWDVRKRNLEETSFEHEFESWQCCCKDVNSGGRSSVQTQKTNKVKVSWVRLNVPLHSLQVISETIFPVIGSKTRLWKLWYCEIQWQTYVIHAWLFTMLYKPVGELAHPLPSFKRPLLSVDVMDGVYDCVEPVQPDPTNFTPPMQTSLLCATRCRAGGVNRMLKWKLPNFCRSAVAPNASSPRVLSQMSWFLNWMFYDSVCLKSPHG